MNTNFYTFPKDAEQQLSDHFNSNEFQCHCKEQHDNMIMTALVDKLEEIRSLIGNKPIKINSGFRCNNHNKVVGGKENSYHKKGYAADIIVSGLSLSDLEKAVEKAGFVKTWHNHPKDAPGWYYIGNDFIHIDVRGIDD